MESMIYSFNPNTVNQHMFQPYQPSQEGEELELPRISIGEAQRLANQQDLPSLKDHELAML